MAQVYVATESFTTAISGEDEAIQRGKTRVSEDHPLVAAFPEYFKAEVGANYGVEQASAAPGEQRNAPAKPDGQAEYNALKDEAKELGIEFKGNPSKADLQAQVDAKKKSA
jgi:hypothetical protein